MKRVQIKICGITNLPDAEACARAGADMIGLNFYAGSPRFIAAERARQIVEALPDGVEPVGVFVSAPVPEVQRIAHVAGVRTVQLHGSASSDVCRSLAGDFRVIRALPTTADHTAALAGQYRDCDILLDAFDCHLHGGSGKLCDWTAARQTRPFANFLILAGGLNAGNVNDAIAAVLPDAIDVCSGVEKSPGLKDHHAIARFVAAVQNAGKLIST